MRRIACALVALVLLASAASAEVSGNLLGLRALAMLTDGAENAAVSPLSLALALNLAREGAAGETLAELDALLAGEAIDASALSPLLRSANAGFVHPEFAMDADYRARVDAKWFELTDRAMEDVNAWVGDMTDGLIPQLLDGPPNPRARLLLLNALAMDAEWQSPFLKEDTLAGTFHAPSGDVEVDFMHQTDMFSYGERNGAKWVELPYARSNLAMYVILPEDGGVSDVLSALSEEGLSYVEDAEWRDVRLSLPRFSLSEGGSLLHVLRALGMEVACSDDADFSRMGGEPLTIGDVVQRVRIDIDEERTRAAATEVEMMPASAQLPAEPVEMLVDRPFALLIADGKTGAIAFAAVVAQP